MSIHPPWAPLPRSLPPCPYLAVRAITICAHAACAACGIAASERRRRRASGGRRRGGDVPAAAAGASAAVDAARLGIRRAACARCRAPQVSSEVVRDIGMTLLHAFSFRPMLLTEARARQRHVRRRRPSAPPRGPPRPPHPARVPALCAARLRPRLRCAGRRACGGRARTGPARVCTRACRTCARGLRAPARARLAAARSERSGNIAPDTGRDARGEGAGGRGRRRLHRARGGRGDGPGFMTLMPWLEHLDRTYVSVCLGTLEAHAV
jgi:hypothetical protein